MLIIMLVEMVFKTLTKFFLAFKIKVNGFKIHLLNKQGCLISHLDSIVGDVSVCIIEY